MPNRKKWFRIGLLLLIIGAIGSAISFSSYAREGEEYVLRKEISNHDIHTIHITADNARITILPSTNDQIIAEFKARDDRHVLEVEENGPTLDIQAVDDRRKWFSFNFFLYRQSLTVYVPERDFEKIVAETNNGKVHIEKVNVAHLEVDTDNGSVSLEHLNSGVINATSDNGQIVLENVQTDNMNARSSNGRLTFNDVYGDITAKTNNGRIIFAAHQIDHSLDFNTDNGRITIQVDEEPKNVTYDLQTGNGSIKVFDSSQYDIVNGNGEHLIQLRSQNGSITIEER